MEVQVVEPGTSYEIRRNPDYTPSGGA